MPDLVADTHAIVWHLTDPRRLGAAAKRALASADAGRATCYVPAMALVEIALLHERGRIRVGPAQVIEQLSAHPGYAVLALDIEQSLEFAALVGVRDPMDRMVLAAARVLAARVISVDEALDGFGVGRVWD